MRKTFATICCCIIALRCFAAEPIPRELRVGTANHAFDHLGNLGEQADAAAASGATIIYASGLGGVGYTGLPDPITLNKQRQAAADYVRRAKSKGIRLVFGYVCATSIVKLETFDRSWTEAFRAQFRTAPAAWRQVGRDGNPLPSWYGGDYQPACMNHPDWRAYEKFMVRQQIESGHDGIFFDNPTVHPEGCYCGFCLKKFGEFLNATQHTSTNSIAGLRELALKQPKDFLRFRATIAADFMDEMRRFARSLNPKALITCNNSLNSPQAFYSQSRTYGYNIYEMSKVEDLIVAEDMGNQPRTLSTGGSIEYGFTYKLLGAISHGKPVVAVTIADGDYHTAPNLMRLAMAEAAAHNASYLSWPTWPENVRSNMAKAVRPQADFLRAQEKFLNDTRPRADVILYLPFQRWVETDQCLPLDLAAKLLQANVQFAVVCEDDFLSALKSPPNSKGERPIFLAESPAIFSTEQRAAIAAFTKTGGRLITADQADWLKTTRAATEPSFSVVGPATIRAVVRDQEKRTIVHLYNLDVQKASSFEDKVIPAGAFQVHLRLPGPQVRSIRLLTADDGGSSVAPEFKVTKEGTGSVVAIAVPKLKISSLLVIE